MTSTVEAGQVWEHRVECRLCKCGTVPHRHRYLVLSVHDGHAMVRDLSTSGGTRLTPFPRYDRPLTVFGSLAKGGLRLCGHWDHHRGRFEPLPPGDLDDRVVEHPRIALTSVPSWRGPIPNTDGERWAA